MSRFTEVGDRKLKAAICFNIVNKLKYQTNEEFIEACQKAHPDSGYDYSKAKYTGSLNEITVICPIHGEFQQNAWRHLHGKGCPKCAREKTAREHTKTTEMWKEQAQKKWGGRYLYDKSVYVNDDTKLIITCPIHGDWEQRPSSHLKGCGCPKCKHDTIRAKKRERYGREFNTKAQAVHGDKYIYDLVDYINEITPVKIICRKHGVFEQKPAVHLRGGGCPYCKLENISINKLITQDEFEQRSNEVHGGKYIYDKAEYKGGSELVQIKCPKHGYFWQGAGSHMRGCGCPKCFGSHGEREISKFLDKHNIGYDVQYVVLNDNLFNKRMQFHVDFKIKDKDIFIEYNGEHHYEHVKHFQSHGFSFEDQQERDMALRQYCYRHKIKLIEIPYWDFDNIETILTKELKSFL